jgi:hypothetical protein
MKPFMALMLIPLLLTFPAIGAETTDVREPVPTTEEEKAFILEQMRLFLASVQQISEGLATGNKAAVAEAAAARGKKRNMTYPNRPAHLPDENNALWKDMGGRVRGGFDVLAAAAEDNAPVGKQLAILGETLRGCVACHQTYRLVDAAH